ncbi:MAG: hypothetical protein IPH09_10635 [bacterium]|nr:hypothetical protein [bacterium]
MVGRHLDRRVRLIFVGCLILSLRLYRGVATPLFFFAGGYCVSVILYHLRLFEYPDVSLTTHLVVMLSIAAFRLGGAAGDDGREGSRRDPATRAASPFSST